MPAAPVARRARRAIGAMFFTVFGGAWCALWVAYSFAHPVPVYFAVFVLTLALLVHVLSVFKAHKAALAQDAGSPEEARRARRFNIINGGQWAVIAVLGNALARAGHGDLVVPMAMFVIGLHFLPLARLYGYRPHYVTGAALMLVAVLSPVLGAIGYLLAGLILWASAGWAVSSRQT